MAQPSIDLGLTLLVVLRDTEPRIWRSIHVPLSTTLWELHCLICDTLDWTVGPHQWTIPLPITEQDIVRVHPVSCGLTETEPLPAWSITLAALQALGSPIGYAGGKWHYQHAGWQIDLTTMALRVGLAEPACTDGAFAGPPPIFQTPDHYRLYLTQTGIPRVLHTWDEWLADYRATWHPTAWTPDAVRWTDPATALAALRGPKPALPLAAATILKRARIVIQTDQTRQTPDAVMHQWCITACGREQNQVVVYGTPSATGVWTIASPWFVGWLPPDALTTPWVPPITWGGLYPLAPHNLPPAAEHGLERIVFPLLGLVAPSVCPSEQWQALGFIREAPVDASVLAWATQPAQASEPVGMSALRMLVVALTFHPASRQTFGLRPAQYIHLDVPALIRIFGNQHLDTLPAPRQVATPLETDLETLAARWQQASVAIYTSATLQVYTGTVRRFMHWLAVQQAKTDVRDVTAEDLAGFLATLPKQQGRLASTHLKSWVRWLDHQGILLEQSKVAQQPKKRT